MNKKTKLAILIGAIAAVVSAIVLVVVFWDKLLALCPCKKKATEIWEADAEAEAEVKAEAEAVADSLEEVPTYNEEELQDFADLEPAEEA